MTSFAAILIPAALLLLQPLASRFLGGDAGKRVSGLISVHLAMSLVLLALVLPSAPVELTWSGLVLSYDGISALMLTLVAFLGWSISRFSVRYLDGEAGQEEFFRWTGFTLGAITLFVLSGDLLLLTASLIGVSLGLHRLLLFFGDRAAARRTASTAFVIGRIGDAALIMACVLLYSTYGTLAISEMTALAQSSDVSGTHHLAMLLIAIAAITKSAQVPFHTWLPLTMETPTPVSALMHAGIVNAGGYVLIRTSPLLVESSAVLMLVAAVGGVTTLYGAVVMLTQTSVKKALAYSTVAQMGFMMLQCGMGAFSAALLHLLAHSLYKAHAFLSSGTISFRSSEPKSTESSAGWLATTAAGGVFTLALVTTLSVAGVDVLEKPGGVLLGGILVLAVTYWASHAMSDFAATAKVLAIGSLLCGVYVGLYVGIDTLVTDQIGHVSAGLASWMLTFGMLAGFAALFGLQFVVSRKTPPAWLSTLYVHASNGFYFESVSRRVFGAMNNT